MQSFHAGPAQARYRSSALALTLDSIRVRSTRFYLHVKFFGYSHAMDDYEKRKLRIFNQINFFQALTGFLVPLLALLLPGKIPASVWSIACWPAAVNIIVLGLNYFHKNTTAILTYFLLYPFCVCLVYLNGLNAGIELYFILFIILAVFFLKDVGFMFFVIGFCMISFFILSVVLDHFVYEVENDNKILFLLNKLISLVFIFYGLFLVKKENTIYQFNILAKQKNLHEKNSEIEKQKEDISEKARLLEKQKEALTGFNAFQNRLFSIISHDLKTPMYALRNLFQQMHQYNLPAEEVKEMVPDVLKDLNHTTGLMENLLQWAKSQMQGNAVSLQPIETGCLLSDVASLLRLQAEVKKITLQIDAGDDVFVCADDNMIHLVLRNLLSNAIKFTPQNGQIEMGCAPSASSVEIYVQDSGVGISAEGLEKIKQKNFYTTNGTCSESGTGLGLMLCHEFLAKNNSQLQIESTMGKGSRFSFVLPKTESH